MKRSVGGMLVIGALLVSVSNAPLFRQAAREKSLYDRLGKDMKSAHMGMGVSGADFDALVEKK